MVLDEAVLVRAANHPVDGAVVAPVPPVLVPPLLVLVPPVLVPSVPPEVLAAELSAWAYRASTAASARSSSPVLDWAVKVA